MNQSEMKKASNYVMNVKKGYTKPAEDRRYDHRPSYETPERTSPREEMGYSAPIKPTIQTINSLRDKMKSRSCTESPLKEWWNVKDNTITMKSQIQPKKIPEEHQSDWKALLHYLKIKRVK